MTPMGTTLRRLRKRAGLSQADVAARAGITQSAYSRLETGGRAPGLSLLTALARTLGTTAADLLQDSGPSAERGPSSPVRAVPLLGRIPAGPPAEADPTAETYPVLVHLAGEGRYVLRVDGSSMSPEIKHGDHILVQYLRDSRPDDLQGRICVCALNGQYTMKRVYVETRRGRRVVVLRGDNPDADPILVTEADEFAVQGRVVAVVGRDL
jgi:repressor LexA